MRIWDIEPEYLCRKHLLGEHRELHGLWNILTKHKGMGGYSKHPETLRWIGKLHLLYQRHEEVVKEMQKRGYAHKSPLKKEFNSSIEKQTIFINTINEQKQLLNAKSCECTF